MEEEVGGAGRVRARGWGFVVASALFGAAPFSHHGLQATPRCSPPVDAQLVRGGPKLSREETHRGRRDGQRRVKRLWSGG